MHDSSLVLPLLDPHSDAGGNMQRRKKQFQWAGLLRYFARRRLKFHLMTLALLLIFAITIIHKQSISSGSGTGSNAEPTNDEKRQRNKNLELFEGRKIKTIVGKYVGPKPLDWGDQVSPNLSQEILNTNQYDPDPELGKDGRPVYLPGYPKDQMKILFSINRFNLVASDKISLDRKLPDPRKFACKKLKYNYSQLPNTSIIIVFHNEAWSTLARTVHSILNTAPKALLSEILLVDDASERSFLGKDLEYYMNNLASMRGVDIKVIRSKDRIGLIKARLLGVREATGKVLTFIDAHCEATTGWLEPLLEQIHLNRTTVVCPIIDIINENTFAFTRSFELHLGAINWGLNFRWYSISRRELVASNGYYRLEGTKKTKVSELIHPFSSPIMAGGLFSIDKDYFNEMGQYDSHMDIWGGENIELSLRLWQCGGQIKIVPCSHVAHIFRKSSPYTFRPGKNVADILYTNLARVAEVWMDEWRHFFYLLNPIVKQTIDKVGANVAFANIDERKQLRTQLQCKSFAWFLENIWPEHFFPTASRKFGKLVLVGSNQCLKRPTIRIGLGQAAVGAVETSNCTSTDVTADSQQLFVYDPETGFVKTDENICLDSGSDPMPTRQIILAPCSESERQKWQLTTEHQLVHRKSKLCLSSPNFQRVQLDKCNQDSKSMKWTLDEQVWNKSNYNFTTVIDETKLMLNDTILA